MMRMFQDISHIKGINLFCKSRYNGGMIDTKLAEYKNEIKQYLESYLEDKKKRYSNFPLDPELFFQLIQYSTSGKMLRGSIILFLSDVLHGEKFHQSALIAASALELLESGILMQDDVMDQDEIRRGHTAIHTFFAHLPTGIPDAKSPRFGESVATCLGDTAFFLAYELLITIPDVMIQRRLTGVFSEQMALLTLGQIDDIYLTDTTKPVTLEESLAMYAGKTSTYTWILPVLAMYELVPPITDHRELWVSIGKKAGLIYQLVDDTIGLFSTQDIIGKPVGSDIREGKKTIYWHYVKEHGTPPQLKTIHSLWGNINIQDTEMTRVLDILKESGAVSYVESLIDQYLTEIEHDINKLPYTDHKRQEILGLIHMISRRNK